MRKASMQVVAVLSVGALWAVCSACSFSASSRSSSASSRSSSRSSSGGDAQETEQELAATKTGFQEEIAAIAVLYAGSNGSAEDFQRDVSAAAKRNGIPVWELDERVFTSIGIGLQRAGVKRDTIPSIPFLQGLRNAVNFFAIGNAYDKGK